MQMHSVPLREQHTSFSPACLRVLFTTPIPAFKSLFSPPEQLALVLQVAPLSQMFFCLVFFVLGRVQFCPALTWQHITDLCYFLHLQILANFPVQTGASNEARIFQHVTRGTGIRRALGRVLCRNSVAWFSSSCMPGKQPPLAAVSASRAELV